VAKKLEQAKTKQERRYLHTVFNIHYASYNIQHTTYNIQHTT
jgi:hypothetical protein